MTTHRTDEEVLALRAAHDAALSTPEMRALRAKVQETWAASQEAARSAAAHARHYGGMASFQRSPDGAREAARDGTSAEYTRAGRHADTATKRVAEAETRSNESLRDYLTAQRAYETARAEALAKVGLWVDGAEVSIGQTSAERASAEAYERKLLDLPPEGWGTSSPTVAERIARWRARPATDRRSDTRPRITIAA